LLKHHFYKRLLNARGA